MSESFILINTFLGVTIGVVAVAWLVYDAFFRVRGKVAERIDGAMREHVESHQENSPIIKDMVRPINSGNKQFTQRMQERTQTWLDQAATGMNVWQFCVISIVTAIFSGGIFWFAFGPGWVLSIGTPLMMLMPAVVVYSRRNARSEQISTQLPDAFSAMSRGLRAGQAVPAVVQMIANDFPKPLSEEFNYFYEQQHLGVPPEVALRDMARRVNVMELRIFTIALIVHKRAGGNLAELLQQLSELVRKRVKMKRRIKSLTGEGRMQAAVLIAMPTIVVLIMALIAPQYISVLLERHDILAGCIISQMIGAFCIYRIVNFSY
ncbi:type II secretion system F family protein [Bremerella sp. T1]|uniref:type II secretion system F family protein n=1 Tax=Bremerella sp. TYQ1 TaxID=3119568 RepID=UPI001CCAB242|nr:type II secretion system F family protein [Bremerella volcania]UBM33865.1 type II secretion system F family protein [Bremerella volcania]